MNETQWILFGIGSFAVGWAMAVFFKNMGRLFERWGLIISYFLFPLIIMYLLLSAEAVMQFKSITLSLIFAAGFFIRMFKHDA
jgi:hypothetical protein